MLAAAGCGGGGGGTTGGGGTSGGNCVASSATGTLTVQITGTPSGNGLVTLEDGTSVTTNTDLTVSAGPHTVTGFLVGQGSAIVRTGYTPVVDVANPCVHAGAATTVHVTYAPIATSGLLWTGTANTPSAATMLGYDPADIGASGTASAAVAANTFGSGGFTFDGYGNMWVIGGTTGDPPVARYPASAFGADGNKTPDVTIDSPAFDVGFPGPVALAFDLDGNLWVSVFAGNSVVKLTPAQLAASGSPTPTVVQSDLAAPEGVAFDASGNMWVAANGDDSVVRIDAAHLTTSGSGADLVITAQTPSPVIGTLSSPFGLAFDADGNLWVNYDGILARLTPTDLAGAGSKTITPAVQIALDVQSLPTGLAFDEAGGLWFADRVGRFARLSPSQLGASGTLVPQIVIASPDLGSAGWFAIYPAPNFTPLAHTLP